jgi:hypothetical protein
MPDERKRFPWWLVAGAVVLAIFAVVELNWWRKGAFEREGQELVDRAMREMGPAPKKEQAEQWLRQNGLEMVGATEGVVDDARGRREGIFVQGTKVLTNANGQEAGEILNVFFVYDARSNAFIKAKYAIFMNPK